MKVSSKQDLGKFFDQVSLLSGSNVALSWADEFVSYSGRVQVYHCEVNINGTAYRTNIPVQANPSDWANVILRKQLR